MLAVVLAGGMFELLGMHATFYAVGGLTLLSAPSLAASPAVRRVR